MPVHTSPHKPAARDPGPQHRLQMCRLLVQDEPGLRACALEIERGGTSYTVDTLSALHASDPDAELTFIVGADTARTLPAWREPARLLELADVAVAGREGTSREQVLRCLRSIAPTVAPFNGGTPADPAGSGAPTHARRPCVRFLSMPLVDISSSQVRERAAHAQPVEELVGARVARYIEAQRLYRDAGAAG